MKKISTRWTVGIVCAGLILATLLPGSIYTAMKLSSPTVSVRESAESGITPNLASMPVSSVRQAATRRCLPPPFKFKGAHYLQWCANSRFQIHSNARAFNNFSPTVSGPRSCRTRSWGIRSALGVKPFAKAKYKKGSKSVFVNMSVKPGPGNSRTVSTSKCGWQLVGAEISKFPFGLKTVKKGHTLYYKSWSWDGRAREHGSQRFIKRNNVFPMTHVVAGSTTRKLIFHIEKATTASVMWSRCTAFSNGKCVKKTTGVRRGIRSSDRIPWSNNHQILALQLTRVVRS
jgi:hypothetical protein